MDAAVSSGAATYTARGGRGLLVLCPGASRGTPLFGADGSQNAAGVYFFQRRREEPPDVRYDPAQVPVLRGNQEFFVRGDGHSTLSRTFNGHEWRFTNMGRHLYSQRVDIYIVMFPVVYIYLH